MDKSHQAHTWRRGFSPLLCTDFRSFISQCCVQTSAPSSATAVYRLPLLHQPLLCTDFRSFISHCYDRRPLLHQPLLCTGARSFISKCYVQAPAPSPAMAMYRRPLLHQPVLCTGARSFISQCTLRASLSGTFLQEGYR